jgi:hypothetical protein
VRDVKTVPVAESNTTIKAVEEKPWATRIVPSVLNYAPLKEVPVFYDSVLDQ